MQLRGKLKSCMSMTFVFLRDHLDTSSKSLRDTCFYYKYISLHNSQTYEEKQLSFTSPQFICRNLSFYLGNVYVPTGRPELMGVGFPNQFFMFSATREWLLQIQHLHEVIQGLKPQTREKACEKLRSLTLPKSNRMIKLLFGAYFVCKYFGEQYSGKPSLSNTFSLVLDLILCLLQRVLFYPQM